MGKKSPQQTDVVVGHNIRFWRLERKMSQTDLANALGLTFQQIQKYENGANRVGASRLSRWRLRPMAGPMVFRLG